MVDAGGAERREGEERREITLSPEYFELTEQGEVVIRSERVQEVLRTADVEQQAEAAGNVSVGVVVSVGF